MPLTLNVSSSISFVRFSFTVIKSFKIYISFPLTDHCVFIIKSVSVQFCDVKYFGCCNIKNNVLKRLLASVKIALF